MKLMELDLHDDSLAETPHRVAKMYVDEIFSGLNYHNFPKITLIENKMQVDEMITVRDITLTSVCEHHFVTIDGKATVSYIPKDKVIGLSKVFLFKKIKICFVNKFFKPKNKNNFL